MEISLTPLNKIDDDDDDKKEDDDNDILVPCVVCRSHF